MISNGQITAGGTASVLCIVPPGPALVIISSDPASASTAYIGRVTSGSLTSTNGVPLAAGAQMTIAGYPGSLGGTISAVTASSTATLGWFVSRG